MSVSPIPEGFHTVTPHIIVNSAADAMEFYKKAFGAEEILRLEMPGGQGIMHAEIKIGDSTIMIAEEFPGNPMKSPKSVGTTTVSLAIYSEDCDAAFGRAVEAGATVEMPPMDMFWGDRYSKVVDPFGHAWEISTHTEDVSPEDCTARAAEFFKNMGDMCDESAGGGQ